LTPERTKVSLRSKGRVIINDVARRLGGGGHAYASGIVLEKPWRQVLESLLPLLEAKIAGLRETE
jgi:nanoRNase/pAp phosphatase (c-di-AMP/oligoRNAs hydrolase)